MLTSPDPPVAFAKGSSSSPPPSSGGPAALAARVLGCSLGAPDRPSSIISTSSRALFLASRSEAPAVGAPRPIPSIRRSSSSVGRESTYSPDPAAAGVPAA